MIRWTEEEVRVLKEMWENPDILLNDMAKVLRSRNRDTIKKKAISLNLTPLSERRKPKIDLDYLRKLGEVVRA